MATRKLTAPTMTAPTSGVTVRMYRQGLGDCFLLAFPAAGKRPFFMLIDCGVLLGTEKGSEIVHQVAEQVLEATGGRLDVLVATHQHWDHLSGFEQARDVFDRLQIGEVWVAWTEDPDDPVARGLRRQQEASLRALTATVSRLRAGGDADSAKTAESLDPVLGFFGDLGVSGGTSAIVRAMDYVVRRGRPPRYRTPGEGPLPLPRSAGARVYVLGPPKDMDFLKRSNPRSGEAYEAALAVNEETAFFAAVLGAGAQAGGTALSPEEKALANLCFPFDKAFRIPLAAGKRDRFFKETYYGGAGGASQQDLAWRRIDTDWLSSSSGLALQLDSNTNNTSLALAIELMPSGKVLLFPGDAQAGNWRSWHTLRWSAGGKKVTIQDLLGRTVLYKVGHHASHNATMREEGLELMEHPDLVAMIPVDEKMARKPKGSSPKGWDMPYPPLLKRLKEKTRGRVLRVDTGLPARPKTVPKGEWQPFEERCVEEKLYLEFTIPG